MQVGRAPNGCSTVLFAQDELHSCASSDQVSSTKGRVDDMCLMRISIHQSLAYTIIVMVVDTNELSDAFLYVGGMTCNVAKLVDQFYLPTLAFVGTAGEQSQQGRRCMVHWWARDEHPWPMCQ